MDTPDAEPDDTTPAADERALRVFVSSTFRDMQRERDELVKRVFPRIRAMCAERGVQWSEIDLRWGVTDEQKAEGAVLPICLAEIDRTRPYFIGMIGQRYGWVPDELPPGLVDQLGWLTDDLGRSVTELEILHGVLRDRNGAPDGHAFFYLRDPAWVETLDDDERSDHLEASPDGARRLAELRDRIRSSGHPASDYADPRDLGRQVLADLTALVERRFPLDEVPDAAERVDAVHLTFGRTRFGLHVDRADLARRLDDHADGTSEAADSPLLVTGSSGVGASSLVTNWAWGRGADALVHHVEADADSADHRAMTARLVIWLDRGRARTFDDLLVEYGAAAPPQLRAALTQAFAAVTEPVVVVLDGVDRLADADRAPDLTWLPDVVPPTVRLVLTASGERPIAAAHRRRWQVLEVPPLDHAERVAIAQTVLAASSKALDTEHLDALVAGPFAGNARFLRIVLDELRQHGDHFTLRPLIDRLTAVASVDDLLELVLERYETDFDRDRPGLTHDVMTAVWAARHGLAESELLEVLGDPGPDGEPEPLPQAVWAPLHLAVEQSLVSRGGLLGFADPDMVRAVEDRYLPDDASRSAAHARLADHFAARPVSDRVVDELGWQQADAGRFDALERTLADLDFVELAARRHPTDLRRLWARLGLGPAETEDRMRRAYQPVVDDPGAHDRPHPDGSRRQLVWAVARLLADAGELPWAIRLNAHLVDTERSALAADPSDESLGARLRAVLVSHGVTLMQAGDLADADVVLSEAMDLARAADDRHHLADIAMNLGIVRRDLGRHDDAASLFAEATDIYVAHDDRNGLQAALGNTAQLHRLEGDTDAAIAALIEQERICRGLADPVAIARALLGQAVALSDRGDVGDALDTMERSAQVCRDEGDLVGLIEALINVAVSAGQIGEADRAMSASDECETAARTLGDPSLLARTLTVRASLLGGLGRWADSATTATEADLTARSADLPRQRAMALGALGTARRELGDVAGAHSVHTDELAAAEATGEESLVATARANLGNVAAAQQDHDGALRHYDAAATVFERLELPSLLLPVAANVAQIHQMAGRFPDALVQYTAAADAASRLGMPDVAKQWAQPGMQLAQQLGDVAGMARLWEVMADVARRTGDEQLLQQALGDRAGLLVNHAQMAATAAGTPDEIPATVLDEIEPLLDEQEAICRRTGNEVGLASCLGNRAVITRYRGQFQQALGHLDEQLAMAQRTNNAQGVLMATANRGEILGLLGRVDEARAELGRARATAQQYGLAPMVQQLDHMIARLG